MQHFVVLLRYDLTALAPSFQFQKSTFDFILVILHSKCFPVNTLHVNFNHFIYQLPYFSTMLSTFTFEFQTQNEKGGKVKLRFDLRQH